MQQYEMESIDLVVVNLYPFAATAAKVGSTRDEVIEQIDMVDRAWYGPLQRIMRRSQWRRHRNNTAKILACIESKGGTTLALRQQLAYEAFEHTAAYDRAIADYLGGEAISRDFPATLNISLRRKMQLRYGENPHRVLRCTAIHGFDRQVWSERDSSAAKSCHTTISWTLIRRSRSFADLPCQPVLSSNTITPAAQPPPRNFHGLVVMHSMATRYLPLDQC